MPAPTRIYNMGIHDGHRKRMKEHFEKSGLTGFSDINALELLLFYSIPRTDTNPIAHALIDSFGSLNSVLSADIEELCKVPGVGRQTAVYLKLISETGKRQAASNTPKSKKIKNTREAAEYLKPLYLFERDEIVYMLSLDSACKILSCREIGRGDESCAGISIRKTVRQAVTSEAAQVILAHNHKSEILSPSKDDIETTKRLSTALDAVGIKLKEHIIISDTDYYSMAAEGYI
ncbi:MAG: RadC family protein [Ruminococcaceae bacterium]|nr:RadC family protein [Oscillospiraceae bacterium]